MESRMTAAAGQTAREIMCTATLPTGSVTVQETLVSASWFRTFSA